MSYQYVNVVTINKVAVIEFNYGRKLNALSKVFIDDLMQALSDLNRPEIRCIILRAPSGSKVFSAGHDIHELPSGGRDPLSYDDPLRQITRMIQKFPKPIISMVEGSVWGGAFEMIMSSDLIIAASTSTFSMTPVILGVPYNLVGIHNLTRDAGFHIVKELIFTASPITAQRALAVEEGWDVDTLEGHIHAIEHVLYPEVVQMLADGRVHVLESGKVAIDAPRG